MKDVPASVQGPPAVLPKTTSLVSGIKYPDQLQCAHCKQFKAAKDHWWCRSCHKTLCSSCNLLQGHTEHRTTPWRPDELVRSLIDSIEARCSARVHRAAEEEAAIREYMREIEDYFLNKLRRQLDERNDDDRGLVGTVCSATGVSASDRKRWPPASHSPIQPLSSSTTSLHPTLVGFDLLTDDSISRLVNEIDRLLPSDSARSLTVTRSPRTPTSARNSVSSSPLLADRKSFAISKSTSTLDGEQDGRSATGATSRFYNFAAVLPDIEPLEFAQLLEQQRDFSPRTRSRSQSGQQARSATPFVEHVSSRAQSPAPCANGTTLSIYGSVDVDAIDDGTPTPEPAKRNLSNRPTVSANMQIERVQIEPPPRRLLITSEQVPPVEAASSVQLMISEDTQTTASSCVTSATQTEAIDHDGVREASSPNGSPETNDTTDGTLPLSDISMESTKVNGAVVNGGSISITAFHFGDDYLTRPIDVRPLPQGQLAVSDSCGGVYVTNVKGEVLHQISMDGFSASSVCYWTPSRPNKDERSTPLLLVSILRKRNRSINFYDARDFTLLDAVDCPVEPQVDLGRSRWLAADDRGAVYMVSGDGKMSALWKYYPASKAWTLLKKSQKTRYQYLDVVHTMTDPTSVTLLTCDGVRGSLLLITVSRTSNSGNNRILAEEDFAQTYGLGRYIKSPASAVVDYLGNMIILDYSTGKLWMLRAPTVAGRKNGTETERRLKLLTEVGPQQGVGLSVTVPWDGCRPKGEHWCYVACFNKKRVLAIKYLVD